MRSLVPCGSAVLFALAMLASTARAQETEAPPERYDWTFRARPVEVASFARLDMGMQTSSEEDGSRHAYGMTQLFSVGIAATEWLVPFVRGGWAFSHDVVDAEGSIFANLELGASAIARISREVRVGGHLSVFLPVGSGQGGTLGPEQRAQSEGVRTRMGIDAPIFTTSYLGFAGAISVAYVHEGLSAQLELGLEPLARTAGLGDDAALAVMGAVHVGYFVIPELSLAVELTHHQWAFQRPTNGAPPDAITSVLVGARAHATIGSVAVRPGVSYSRALGGFMEAADYHVLQLDLLIELGR